MTFSAAEHEERLRRLRQSMVERDVDVLIVDEVEHLAYLIGYLPSAATYQACLITVGGDVVAVVRELDLPTFLDEAWPRDYVTFADWEDPIALLVATIAARGWGRSAIGQELDSHFLLVKRFQAIQRGLPQATFKDFSGVLWDLRLQKSDGEIALHERAGAIADEALAHGVSWARPGVTEREIAGEVNASAVRAGADNTRLALIVGGARTANLHGRLGDHVMADRDLLHVELVPHYRGYSSRAMRPVSIGVPHVSLVSAINEVVAAQDEQFALMRPGAVASDVDRVVRDVGLRLSETGRYPNTTGYTLGFIATPRTSDFTRTFLPNSAWTLQEGMVFHMYVSVRGVAISDTVVVTPDGGRRLTLLPRRVLEAGELLTKSATAADDSRSGGN